MLSYCVARVILVAKIENWWPTLIQYLLIISAYYLWFALKWFSMTDVLAIETISDIGTKFSLRSRLT